MTDMIQVGGRGSGKRALARRTAAQYARDQIANGVDPQTLVTFASVAGVHTLTYEEAAEMAFVGDIIDKELERVMKAESQ